MPAERLRAALLAFYDYYRRAEEMLVHAVRDVPQLPGARAVLNPWDRFMERVRRELQAGWPARGRGLASD